MKKFFFILSILFSLTQSSYSQITKGNWLIGGSARFALTNSKIETAVQTKRTEIGFLSTIGYFPINKFAIGIKPGYTYGKVSFGANSNKTSIFLIGPFARYYFLQPEKIVNIFSEINYQFKDFNIGGKSNSFSILAGPVAYFNSAVGVEFATGFILTKAPGLGGNETEFFTSLGLIIHLEKDK